MANSDSRRMILRKLDPEAEDAASVASRVEATPGVDILDHPSPSAMLVDGWPAAIEAIVKQSLGWTAIPVTTFGHPETRPKVRRPPE